MNLRTAHFIVIICLLVASCHRAPEKVVFVEVDGADRITQGKQGTEMLYRGVLIGHVESISLSGVGHLPLAKVLLLPDSPPLMKGDKFRITASGLLGDPYIDVIPATGTDDPLSNGATVRAEMPPAVNLADQIGKITSDMDIMTDLNNLPEPKRAEVLAKIRKLIDDAQKEAVPNK